MDEHGRSLYPVCVSHRRTLPQLLGSRPRRLSSVFIDVKGKSDLAAAKITEPVGEAPLAYSSREPVRVADDPVGHPTAVAAAGDTDPGRIDGRILFTYVIHKLHEILEVDGAVFFSQVRELVAAAVAAPWGCRA